ncbi:hypothetical protein NAEGRDRAFT_57890 [Naegleria gruberi]|uniref:Uncharacterized protein n=1 Tax=Naegleria gruberi TaxID=5762 RepID=D2VDR1_NAEGR|nr:uncharacterized protein NAEGRDRAFT_57890 [Naegleria gruberi]EFC45044.1 hypothetical protein NAEGRDRAFT_57890 [Naegleria gruberi]|eukprot:XP_002677788.1 hypothetical protein NAEGRDRAFT_57890 [Naegleria gruberi strain NEG-M]
MTKQKKKKNQTTPSSASKRKSQTLSLDEFLSPSGMNLMQEIDSATHHHHHHEDVAENSSTTIAMNGNNHKKEEEPSQSRNEETIVESAQSIEIVINGGEESKITNDEEHSMIDNQTTITQEPISEQSNFEQNPNKEESSNLNEKPIEENVIKEELVITTTQEITNNSTEEATLAEETNPEKENLLISSSIEMDSVSTAVVTATLVNHHQESPSQVEFKEPIKQRKEETKYIEERNAVAKRVLEKLSINTEIRKTSFKDLSHVTKMTLITQEPTNSNICCAFVTLESPISHEDLRSRLDKRVVQQYARFRSTVSNDYNTFCDQGSIDIEQHIRYMRVLKSGNREYSETEEHELVRELLGKLVCEPFDFSKPLWECIVIDNCPAMGYLLLFRIHHAIGDGSSLVMFFSQFCDQGEEHFKEELHERKGKLISKTIRSLEHVPVIGYIIRMIAFMWLLWGLLMVALKWISMIIRGGDKSLFKTKVSTEKQVSWTRAFDIADVKLVAKKICNNSTVNDIVLNSLSGALLRFTERRSNNESNMKVTLSVPVNIRLEEEEFNNLSNKFGFMLVPLNLKNLSRNPESRLLQIKKVMDKSKRLPEPFFTYQSCRLVNILQKSTVSTIYKFVSNWVSAVFTNIVGSSTQLTVENVKVSNLVVFAPSPASVGLSFAVSSHNGKLVLGVCADTLTANPQELVKDFENDLDQIISMAKSLDLH